MDFEIIGEITAIEPIAVGRKQGSAEVAQFSFLRLCQEKPG
jgi:hypothetical protein